MGDLTRNFSTSEFACKHCGELVLDPNLPKLVQQIRDYVSRVTEQDVPIIISSGYRCPEHNRDVGGVPGSQHTRGRAADIYSHIVSAKELHSLILAAYREHRLQNLGGLGQYQTFVHVDTHRVGNRLRRWKG